MKEVTKRNRTFLSPLKSLKHVWGIRTLLWLFFNTINAEAIPGHRSYVTRIARMPFRPFKASDICEYAKEQYAQSVDAIKESNDRIEKLLALVLLALGWIASKEPLLRESLIFAGLAATILVCGRIKIEAFCPATFEDFTNEATQFTAEQQLKYVFNRACQYERAVHANQFAVWLNHIRLSLGGGCLVASLIYYGLRL